jgi:hypothetical protein
MKKLRVFFAVLLTVTTLAHSRPSQAAIGAAVSTPVLIAGIVITAVTGVGTLATLSSCRGDSSGLCAGLTILVGGPLVLLGLVVLDGEQGVEFKELSNKEASKLGVSATELAIYNSEVDQANMLMADVKSELSEMNKPTAEDSKIAWDGVKDMVSPETFATMQKIVSQK